MSALKQDWTDSAKIGGPEVRADLQQGWHMWAGGFFRNREILDVGAGIGNSRERMQASGNRVTLQDLAPDLAVDLAIPVDQIETASFDVVTCFDVIEHVAGDAEFLRDLIRIARNWVVITTPNHEISKCWNPYHCREYTPAELLDLLGAYRIQSLWGGNPGGTDRAMLTVEEFRVHRWPSHAVILTTTKV